MRIIAITAFALTLAGCATGTLFTSRNSPASQHFYAIQNECAYSAQQYHCMDEQVRNDPVLMGDPDSDLLLLGLAYAKAVETRVANGQMTKDDGDVAIAEVRSRVMELGEERVRDRQISQEQAYESALQGYAVYSAMSRPYTLQPSPTVVTCWQNGPYVTCQ
jgi:hypothetical protein